MSNERDLETAKARLAWAVQRLELSGISLTALGMKVGCSHATLSHWKGGKTAVENIKVGLLSAFCEHSGVSMPWLLKGEGPRFSRYISSELVAGLAHKLAVMERDAPDTLSVVVRMIDAAADKPPQ